ncbi:MAG: hypothetical protein WD534_17305 [Phycisphaeraceae bacterium]
MRYAWIVAVLAAVVAGSVRLANAEVGISEALAEPPFWPIGLRLPDELVGEQAARRADRPADVLVWVPPDADRIRAIMLVPNNTDSKHFHEHPPLRAVAGKHEAAIVYLRTFHTGIEYHHQQPVETPPAAPQNILKLLALIADQTEIPEFRHAPWVTFGKSSRGEFPFRLGWLYPERTIAGITYHGETPTWPIPPYAEEQDHSILYLAANGQEEWSGTWYRHVRPSMLNYRAQTAWLLHQVVAHDLGHGDYVDGHGSEGWGEPVPEGAMSVLRIWDYLALFVDKALALRLPEEQYPTEGPVELRQVDPASGYLLHPRAVEELLGMEWMAFRQDADGAYTNIPWPDEPHPVIAAEQGTVDPQRLIRRAADVPRDERAELFWVADRELAEAWLKLHNVQGLDIELP